MSYLTPGGLVKDGCFRQMGMAKSFFLWVRLKRTAKASLVLVQIFTVCAYTGATNDGSECAKPSSCSLLLQGVYTRGCMPPDLLPRLADSTLVLFLNHSVRHGC